MSVQSTKNRSNQPPIAKAIGLFASCAVVVLGGWMGLRPETILVRAVVVGCVTAFLIKLVVDLVNSADDEEDD